MEKIGGSAIHVFFVCVFCVSVSRKVCSSIRICKYIIHGFGVGDIGLGVGSVVVVPVINMRDSNFSYMKSI